MAKRKGGTPSSPKSKPAEGLSGAASRTRTRERRQERERQRRRQNLMAALGAVVVIAVVAIFLVVISNQPAEAPIPAEALTRYADLEQGKTEEGFPMLGSLNAPVQVKEYSSFDCPHCVDFHDEVLPGLLDRVRAGEISLAFVPLYGGNIPNAQGAAQAAVCAGEQNAFWSFHDALFSWQVTYGATAFTPNRISTGIDNLGIDRSAYNDCMDSDLPGNVVTAAFNDADALGSDFVGTPSVTVNGVVVTQTLIDINAAINNALALVPDRLTPEVTPEVTAVPSAETTPEVTPEATESLGD